MSSLHVNDKRYFVKIEAGPNAGGNPCIYLNKDFTYECFNKWQWFFQYKAALYKVRNPRHYVQFYKGSIDYVPTAAMELKKRKDKIASKKGMVTKFEKLLQMAKADWNSLFPIEDDKDWIRAVAKTDRIKMELAQLLLEENNSLILN